MITQTREAPSRRLVAAIAAVVALIGVSVPLVLWWVSDRSSATFADSEVLDSNYLGAATLDLEGGVDNAAVAAENLAPGDSVSGQLELTNAGSLPLRFGLSAFADGSILGDWLLFELWPGSGVCSPGQPGERIASNVLLSPTPTVLLEVSALAAGSSPQLLLPGESATLCLGASLPLSAPNEVQGRRLEVTITMVAEHAVEVEQ